MIVRSQLKPNLGMGCMGCLGDVNDDSPGESGSISAAFAYAMQNGGCSYQYFTPEACTAGFGAWQQGISSGYLTIDSASFYNPQQGQTQQYMYSVIAGSPSVAVGSGAAASMIATAAANLGISSSSYIAPVLASPGIQVPVTLPSTLTTAIPSNTPIDAPVPVVSTNTNVASTTTTGTSPQASNPTTTTVNGSVTDTSNSSSTSSTSSFLTDFMTGLENVVNPSQWQAMLGGDAGNMLGLLSPLIVVGVYMMMQGQEKHHRGMA